MAVLALQGGGCALCGYRPEGDAVLHVDHDHETGDVRGLLCFRCNNALGALEDDMERLQSAAADVNAELRDPVVNQAIEGRVAGLKAMAAAGGE